MAPSSQRRSGYSRRAQYSTFFGYMAGVLGAVIGAALLIVSFTAPEAFSGLRGAAARASEPAGGAASRTRSAGRSVFAVLEGYALAGSRYAKMERELKEAKVRLAQASALKTENARLRAVLGLRRENPDIVTVTRLTSSTAASARRFATIGAGSRDGVRKGMPVRSPLGLIGRVLEVSPANARILLITDTESLVPVRRASDGVPGFAQGRGDGTLQVRLINLGINPLKKGDIFVTSGSGGLYRAGTPMAVATAITRDGAYARIISDPSATDFVVVEPAQDPDAIAPADAAASDAATRPDPEPDSE